jgi:Fe-S cluster assembly iron-binding protein IscA
MSTSESAPGAPATEGSDSVSSTASAPGTASVSGTASAPGTAVSAPDEATSPRIHISESALERIVEMLTEEELLEEGGLRLSARLGAGCSSPLGFDMVMEVEPEPDDLVLTGAGIRLFLSARDTWSLDGLHVDYVSMPGMGEGFAFRHPRGAGGRAC